MRVVHIISGLNAGGAERFVLELCRQSLQHHDPEMSVLSLSGANNISNEFKEAGIPLTFVPQSGRKRGIKDLAGFTTLLRMRVDVIHAHMFHACIVACAVKLFRPSVKLVFTLHNNHVPQFHRRLLLFLTKSFRNADIVFPGLRRKWFQKKNAVEIPTAIDINKFQHTLAEKPPLFTCAFIGRLSHEKNPLQLIDIAKALVKEHNFLIRVAGDGILRETLQQRINDEHLEDHLVLHGYVEDVRPLLGESHCLLIPSHWEGMPLVLVEAGAAGVPVIATPVGNIPSVLNTANGYVGEVDQFPQLIENVMNNYGDALIKARNLMHKVHDEFSIQSCYKKHVALYSQMHG